MNWTLIAVISIMVVLTFIGARKGLVKMAFSALSVLAIVILTSFIAPHACTAIASGTEADEAVREKTQQYLSDKNIIGNDPIDIDDETILLPKAIKDNIADKAQEYINKGYEAYNNYVVDVISRTIFSAIVYVAVFIVICILIFVLYGVLNIVSRLPVLKQVNRLAGGIIGAVMGLLIVWVLMIVFTSIGNTQLNAVVSNDINNNVFLKFLYDRNLLLHAFVKVFKIMS